MKRILMGCVVTALAAAFNVLLPPHQHARSQDKKEPPKRVYATGYIPPSPLALAGKHAAAVKRHGNRIRLLTKSSTPPAKFDCVDMGWVPPVRDQGSCGSCYLVSTCDAVTCAFIKAGYGKADDTFKISDQYGMDCHDFGGCNGGWGAEVVDWMKANGFPAERYIDGTTSKSDYVAYEARSRSCRKKADAKLWRPADWGYCSGDQSDRPATTAEMKASIMQYGVLNIALDAGGQFGSYSGGVIETLGRSINHEITLTGWDDSKGKKGAWRVRNQWSTDWGEGGYGWLGYDCYIVEAFWVSATALPPVPPDPVPPGPIPPVPPGPPSGRAVSVTINYDDGTTQILPDPHGIIITKDTTVEDILKAIGDGKFKLKSTKEPPLLPDLMDPRWREQEQVNKALLLGFKDIAKELSEIKRSLPPMKP